MNTLFERLSSSMFRVFGQLFVLRVTPSSLSQQNEVTLLKGGERRSDTPSFVFGLVSRESFKSLYQPFLATIVDSLVHLHAIFNDLRVNGCYSIDSMASHDTKVSHVNMLIVPFFNQRHSSNTVYITRVEFLDFLKKRKREMNSFSPVLVGPLL